MSVLLIIGLKNAILVVPLALVAMAVGRWSRRPALSHLLWTLVLVKLLTPPLLHVPVGLQLDVASWLQSDSTTQVAQLAGASTNGALAKVLPSTKSSLVPAGAMTTNPVLTGTVSSPSATAGSLGMTANGRWTVSSLLSWQRLWQLKVEILLTVWLTGSVLVLCKLVWRSIQFHSFLKLVEKRHESLGPRAAELAARARITIAPRVIVVDSVVSPMLWGMGRRACLVFPAKLVSRLSQSELDALLLHELAHFARGDHWVRVLELLASVLYWWHPVFWWARNELEVSEEQCCDAWVVEHQSGSRHSYAEALLATIDFLHEPATSRPPAACGLGDVPFLRTRLTQIMRGQVAARLPYSLTTAIIVGGLLCSPLEPAVWAGPSGRPSLLEMAWRSAQFPSSNAPAKGRVPALSSSSNTPDFSQQIASASISQVQQIQTNPRKLYTPPNSTRPPALLWAAAHSPNGKYHLEARIGHRTTLVKSSPDFRLDLTSHQITCISFAPDSKTFASGHEDAGVRRWDSDTGGVLQTYKGCNAPITSVHISPDGTRLVAGTRSGTVIVWDIASGDEISRLDTPGVAVSCVRWSPRGDRLGISLGDWSEREAAQFLVWSPIEDALLVEQSLSQPIGAFNWMDQAGTLLTVAWDGSAQMWNTSNMRIVTELEINKDQVSAANWAADCSLMSRGFDLGRPTALNR